MVPLGSSVPDSRSESGRTWVHRVRSDLDLLLHDSALLWKHSSNGTLLSRSPAHNRLPESERTSLPIQDVSGYGLHLTGSLSVLHLLSLVTA